MKKLCVALDPPDTVAVFVSTRPAQSPAEVAPALVVPVSVLLETRSFVKLWMELM